MNLYMKINNLYNNDKSYWDYYEGMTVNPIDNPSEAARFISEFFSLGSKENIFCNTLFCENENTPLVISHDAHTIKVFFIGIILQQLLDGNLSIKSNSGTDYPFSYFWYLTCLFHDFGYRFEENLLLEREYSRVMNIKTSNAYRFRNLRLCYYRVLRIDAKSLSPNIPLGSTCYLSKGFSMAGRKIEEERICDTCSKQCKGYIYFSNGTVVEKNHYSSKIKNNYFEYILFEHNKKEHGISGADYLFYKLVKNYRNKSAQLPNRMNSVDFIDNFNRRFYCEQFKIFAYIADCIASHNVWKAPKNSEELYKKYGLESLIGNQFRLISYKDNPLLFILCLSDSIEPTKQINDLSESEVLKNIEFDYCHGYNKLKVFISKEMSENVNCQVYIKKLESIEAWIDVRLEVILV